MASFNGKVTGGSLAFRANPPAGTNYGNIPNNTNLTVNTLASSDPYYSARHEWFKTTYNGKTGYVMARWIAITTGGTAATVTTSSGSLNIRKNPPNGDVSFTVPKGASIRILEGPVSNFYRIGCSSGTGWGSCDYITAGGSGGGTGSWVTRWTNTPGETVNVRNGPGKDYDVIKTLSHGTKVEVNEPSSTWSQVRLYGDANILGYMMTSFLVASNPSSGGSGSFPRYAEINGTGVKVRNAANGENEIGRWSQPARFMVYESQSVNGATWYRTNINGRDGWIHGDYVSLLPAYDTDYANRMVDIAQSFVGHAGTGSRSAWQFSGQWCQSFVNAIWKQTGTLSTINRIPNSSNCKTSAVWFQTNNMWHATPNKGDWVYYRWAIHENTSTEFSHVGLVIDVDPTNGTITTVEGNRDSDYGDSGSVTLIPSFNYSNYSTSRVLGFGRPAFS